MTKLLLAASIAAASLASPASALVECQDGDVDCYRMCYLPHYEKDRGVYWVNC